MTRAMKITFTVAAVVGFIAGSVLGWYNAEDASDVMQSAGIMSASEMTSNFAWEQFEHADSGHARQAVLLQIKILEHLERLAHETSNESWLGFAYTRLAVIEESAGQADAERRALDQARTWFTRAHPRDEHTDQQMKDTLKRLDKVLEARQAL
jgi:hypothetical protein